MNNVPCVVCSEAGHHPRSCPTLHAPLKDGFYAPPAGHRPSGDDDDDENLKKSRCVGTQTFRSKAGSSPLSALRLVFGVVLNGVSC